jgi:hypothetical protein
MKRRFFQIVFATTLFSLSILFIYSFAWTGPSSSPPQGNVSPPLTVSNVDQVKSGRLGIGVSNLDSSYQLTVGTRGIKVTNTSTEFSLYIEDQQNDLSPFVIDASGNVGIGTTNPNYKLDVSGDIRVGGGDIVGPSSGNLRITSNSGYVDIRPNSGTDIRFDN